VPSCFQRMTRRSGSDLMMSRSAWIVASGVLAERGVERVVGEPRHALQAPRLQRMEPGPGVEEAVPERQGHRQVVGRDDGAEDAGIGRRQLRIEFGNRTPRHQEAEALGQRREEALDLFGAFRQRVEGDDHAGRRARRDDAALMRPVERLDCARLFALRGLRDL
jgi:hypothetical protein